MKRNFTMQSKREPFRCFLSANIPISCEYLDYLVRTGNLIMVKNIRSSCKYCDFISRCGSIEKN